MVDVVLMLEDEFTVGDTVAEDELEIGYHV